MWSLFKVHSKVGICFHTLRSQLGMAEESSQHFFFLLRVCFSVHRTLVDVLLDGKL